MAKTKYWILDIQNLSKEQVLECCEMALEYKQVKGVIRCWYELKSILTEDLTDAKKRAKEKFGIELKYKISKSV